MFSFKQYFEEMNDNTSPEQIKDAIKKAKEDLMRAKSEDEILFLRKKISSLHDALDMKEEFISATKKAKPGSMKPKSSLSAQPPVTKPMTPKF